MKIWIKEFGSVKQEIINVWLKKDIVPEAFNDWSDVKYEDIVIVSQEDTTIEKEKFYEYNVVIYEEVFQRVTYSIMDNFTRNYDYYYLKNSFFNAYDKQTIITGSSYGLYGIDTSQLTNEINLSLTSQDLFYSAKGIYEVSKINTNIKNVVLCCGYYYFFNDLSRTKNLGELSRVSRVYDRLSWGRHNGFIMPPRENTLYYSDFFDVDKIADLYSLGEWEKGYFTAESPRDLTATKEWDDKSKKWTELSEQEKAVAGERRAALHNKDINRIGTLKENIQIFHELAAFCNDRDINLYVAVTPVTSYYKDKLDNQFKEIFYSILNDEVYSINVIDSIDDESGLFSDDDFNDTYHLNERGAQKFTDLLLQAIYE